MKKLIAVVSSLMARLMAGFRTSAVLGPGQVATLRHGKGRQVLCTSGRLWVTLEHHSGDYILEPAQSLEINENGRVVIGSLDFGAYKVA